ncbi:Uncharacterized protein TCM_027377 [Theobroma cacao]|uniref:Uncharacterized protein n=1 Tax=Theobroma cacao TaxID=3641 RepID=A0A061GG16_THECC|nr:Uncharacterized protein TCM_027377 [Theobroma cacao]
MLLGLNFIVCIFFLFCFLFCSFREIERVSGAVVLGCGYPDREKGEKEKEKEKEKERKKREKRREKTSGERERERGRRKRKKKEKRKKSKKKKKNKRSNSLTAPFWNNFKAPNGACCCILGGLPRSTRLSFFGLF